MTLELQVPAIIEWPLSAAEPDSFQVEVLHLQLSPTLLAAVSLVTESGNAKLKETGTDLEPQRRPRVLGMQALATSRKFIMMEHQLEHSDDDHHDHLDHHGDHCDSDPECVTGKIPTQADQSHWPRVGASLVIGIRCGVDCCIG
eukprot:2196423-Rhodomonas_salina.1